MIDIIIIGCGPAGIAASIQLKRYGYDFIVIEKDNIGGLALNANLIENYPGFPSGISGIDICDLFKQQLKHHNICPIYEEVLNVDILKNLFYIKTNKSYYRSRFLIIASGTKPKPLNIPNIKELIDKYIYYEIKDLRSIKDKDIAIIGAGDAAFDYAVSLSSSNNITIFSRSNTTKCIPPLLKKSKEIDNITHLINTSVIYINLNENKKLFLEYYRDGDKEVKDALFDIVIPAIGRIPSDDFISERIFRNKDKLTTQKSLFMIGDLVNEKNRQIGIAVGNAISSAMQIRKIIEG